MPSLLPGKASPSKMARIPFPCVEIIPFRTPARDQRHYLVLFEATDSRPLAQPVPPRMSPDEISDFKDVQISQLKQELASTKEYLQSIIEAQEATNEELQSANEEIQSGNEELQKIGRAH